MSVCRCPVTLWLRAGGELRAFRGDGNRKGQGDSGHSGGTQSQERRCPCGTKEELRTGTPAGTQLVGGRRPRWAGGRGARSASWRGRHVGTGKVRLEWLSAYEKLGPEV